jgi:hypothetical protein
LERFRAFGEKIPASELEKMIGAQYSVNEVSVDGYLRASRSFINLLEGCTARDDGAEPIWQPIPLWEGKRID